MRGTAAAAAAALAAAAIAILVVAGQGSEGEAACRSGVPLVQDLDDTRLNRGHPLLGG